MPSCEEFHKSYDRIANGEVQAGTLPAHLHIQGRVAWYVAQGPYSKLGDMWQEFMRKVRASNLPVMGPPGDLYVCDPEEHRGPAEKTLSTIMWAPLKKLPGENR